MDNEAAFCGEMGRHGGRHESSAGIGWFLAAPIAAWALRPAMLALVAIIGGCAHTSISRNDVECGNFSSSDIGVGIIHVPAGQYERYALACGTERFSRVVANQRMAVVAGAHAAAGGGLARKEILDVKHNVRTLARTVVQLGNAVAADKGGAK